MAARRPRVKTEAVILPDTPERQARSAIARINAAEVNGGRAPSAASKAAAAKKIERAERAARARQADNQRINGTAPTPVKAEPQEFDLDASIRAMSRENIECRDLRHQWKAFTVRENVAGHYYEDVLRCARCRTERVRLVNSHTGQLLDSHYNYADGYVMVGSGRMTTSMNESLRLASIRMRLVKGSAE